MRSIRFCRNCGCSFHPQNGRQRYCNTACRRKAERASIAPTETCRQCGKPLPPVHHTRQIYCSASCNQHARADRLRAMGLRTNQSMHAQVPVARPPLPPIPPVHATTRQLLQLFYDRYHTDTPVSRSEIANRNLCNALSRLMVDGIIRVIPSNGDRDEPTYDLDANGVKRLRDWGSPLRHALKG